MGDCERDKARAGRGLRFEKVLSLGAGPFARKPRQAPPPNQAGRTGFCAAESGTISPPPPWGRANKGRRVPKRERGEKMMGGPGGEG